MTDNIWFITDFATSFFDIFITYMFYKSVLGQKLSFKRSFYILGSISIFLLSGTSYILNSNQVLTVIVCFITSFLYALLFDGKLKAKLLYSIAIVALMGISEIFTLYFLMFITNISSQILLGDSPYRLAGILTSKVFFLISVKLLGSAKNYKNLNISISYWVMLISTPLLSLIIMLTLSFFSATSNMISKFFCILSTIFLIYIDIIVFYLFDKSIEFFYLKTQHKLLEQQSDYELKCYQDSKTSINEIKGLRHDMKNHLFCISDLLRTNHIKEAEDYIDSVAEILKISSRYIYTENPVLDSILNSKIIIIKSRNIQFSYNIEIPRKIKIEPMDICVLFGNALDNAIEACERIKAEPKNILMILTYRNNSLIFSLKNTTNESLVKCGNYYMSSKSKHKDHGVGLSNIERTVEKYNGILDINHKNNIFELTAVLYNL
jgi:two-component system, LytTR family, sensor histidine kinase AgrC